MCFRRPVRQLKAPHTPPQFFVFQLCDSGYFIPANSTLKSADFLSFGIDRSQFNLVASNRAFDSVVTKSACESLGLCREVKPALVEVFAKSQQVHAPVAGYALREQADRQAQTQQ